MAVSAAAVTAKLVALTLSDRNGRTVVFSVIAALVTPVILIATMIMCTLSGTVDHNISAVQLSFHGGYLSSKVPAEYRMYIENMQDSFEKLDGVLNEINGMAEAEEVDPYQVKAIFYALFFGKEYPRMDEGDYRAFADCFVEYEEREDEEGETYTVAIPIQSLNMVYGNLAAELNQEVSLEDKTNVQRIYMLAKYGVSVPGGNGLPPGQAMGDGSFSALMASNSRLRRLRLITRHPAVPRLSTTHCSLWEIPMYGAVVLQTPVSTAVDISVGSTRDPGCIIFLEQQLRGFMTSVRLCQERKLDPEIWCFLRELMHLQGRSAMWGFMLEALGCCIVVRLLAMRTLLLLTVCFWKAGNYSGMRQLKMKFVQICLDSLWICDIDF